ncbi:MAG: ribosomal-processing cysteine protease Prp [Thermotogaceae bacterium]|nr:ribosomal-processing cysteine protease Prp [Thermotogaceae bacterium]
MIRVTLSRAKNGRVCLEVMGHSGFAVKGKDIVCAAVSTLIQHTARILSKRKQCYCEKNDGFLKMVVLHSDELSKLLLNELLESLRDIEAQFPENLFVEVKENANRHTTVCSQKERWSRSQR